MSQELPHSTEVEKKLLSSMMLKEGTVIPTIASILKGDDFYRVEHKLIYETIIKFYNKTGVQPDLLLVQNELEKLPEWKNVRQNYLLPLLDYEHSTSRAEAFAHTIKDKSILRQMIQACQEILQDSYNEILPSEVILEKAEKKFSDISTKYNSMEFEQIGSILERSFDRIRRIHENPEETTGVKTSLIYLDKILNGFQKSDLILLAARPSMGKTALALNMAVNAAKNGYAVAIFSLEMSKEQIGDRMLSLQSGVNSLNLRNGGLIESDMNNLISAVEELSKLRLYVDDSPGIGIMEMRSKLRNLKKNFHFDLVVIDYLQLMHGTRTENRQQEISEISRNLKSIARMFDVPILALSQLSRSVEMRAEKKPQLSDLRESGSLEQDADIVMFLYRDEYYNRDDSENENIAELIIAKNRNGPTTTIRLQFQKEIMRFGDLTRAAE